MRRSRYTIDLPKHMAECDANYLRLKKLFPAMREAEETVFALSAPNGPRVRIQVLERSPYTSLLRLVQEQDDAWSADPSMKVRLYHDARSAEVVEFQNERRFEAVYDYPNRQMRQKDEKAQINRFLGEYLAHCLRHGVSLDKATAVSN